MLTWAILGGLSTCLIFTPATVVVGHWFMRRRALATSLALTAGGFGGVIFPFIILATEDRIGFNTSMRIIGIICAVLCMIPAFTVRTRIKVNEKSSAMIDVTALWEKVYGMTTFAIFLLEFGYFIPLTYITSYALAKGMDKRTAYALIMLLNAGSIAGRSLSGWLADALGRFRIVMATTALCTALTPLWLFADSDKIAIMVYAVLYGFASGSIIAVTPVCVAQICRTEDYGKRYGTTYFIVSFGTLVAVPVAGTLLEMGDGRPNYDALILFSGAVFAAGLLCLVLANGWATRWNYKVKF